MAVPWWNWPSTTSSYGHVADGFDAVTVVVVTAAFPAADGTASPVEAATRAVHNVRQRWDRTRRFMAMTGAIPAEGIPNGRAGFNPGLLRAGRTRKRGGSEGGKANRLVDTTRPCLKS